MTHHIGSHPHSRVHSVFLGLLLLCLTSVTRAAAFDAEPDIELGSLSKIDPLHEEPGHKPKVARQATNTQTDISTPAPSSDFGFYGCFLAIQGYLAVRGQLPVNEHKTYNTNGMTLEICWATCQQDGYTYAGTLFGYICYCDNTVHKSGGPATDINACNTPCTGNNNQSCGGYKYINGTENYYQAVWAFNYRPSSTILPTAILRSTSSSPSLRTVTSVPSSSSNSPTLPPISNVCTPTTSATFNADLMALSVSGQAFCTSYISYSVITLPTWVTARITVIPTTTLFVTAFGASSTVTVNPRVTVTTYLTTTTFYVSTVTVYATNQVTLGTQYVKRREELPTADKIEQKPYQTWSPEADQWLPFPPDVGHGVGKLSDMSPQAAAPIFARQAVATPSVVMTWNSTQISSACSRIATGSVTSTYTVTYTATSGTIVATSTITVNGNSAVSTATAWYYGGISSTTVLGPTTTTDYSCPMQTQIAGGCMVIRVHGPYHVDGLLLRANTGNWGTVDTAVYSQVYVWYMNCKNQLLALRQTPALLGGWPSNPGYFGLFASSGYNGSDFFPATCVKNTTAKSIDCILSPLTGYNRLRALPPTYAVQAGTGYIDARAQLPLWPGDRGDLSNTVPISLTYEEVQCPCVLV